MSVVRAWLFCWTMFFFSHAVAALTVNNRDQQLQQGAQHYMDYCAGCHSLEYSRYRQTAQAIGWQEKTGTSGEAMLARYLHITADELDRPVQSSLPTRDAIRWFGRVPPDLTLIARVRGVPWLRKYLHGFYLDPDKPFGVNNHLLPELVMPDALAELRGNNPPSELTADEAIEDLLAFLVYVSEPTVAIRHRIGIVVIVFLSIFFLLFKWRKKLLG